VFAGTRRESELAGEIESHLQMQTEDNLRVSMPLKRRSSWDAQPCWWE
jgi:hypothetical protein